MNYRISLSVIAALLMTGCASSLKFTGISVTDQTLRQDVYQKVSMLFEAKNGCSIENVNSQIIKITKTESGSITAANELWAVSGCNKQESYNIQLRADANGETDFSIKNIK